MNRLKLPPAELARPVVVVRGERLTYLRDVLRLRPGDPIELFDGEGRVHPSRLSRWVEAGAELQVGEAEARPFTGVRVTVAQGLPKGDKLELVVQKAVELGAMRLVPLACERSVTRLTPEKAAERLARWRRIADEAARQCGRADAMAIDPVTAFDAFVARAPDEGEVRLVLDEEERTRRLRDALGPGEASYTVIIGPEGGLTRDELRAATSRGFIPVTLGPRVLRTETVALAALAILQHVRGDLG